MMKTFCMAALKKYFEDGELKSSQTYTKGKLTGVAKEYHPNGKLKTEQFYINNMISSVKEYDENGFTISSVSDSWGSYRHPDQVGATSLTKGKFNEEYTIVIQRVRENITSRGWKPGKFYAVIEPVENSSQVKVDLWHYDTFLDVNKNEVGNVSGKSHTLFYDFKQDLVTRRQVWQ